MTTANEQLSDAGEPHSAKSLIAAIGASAENLPALSAVLAAIPADASLTIVVAPRASPGGREVNPESLAPLTKFRVTRIADGALVLPGHLYVTPAHALVGVKKGRFLLRSPRNAGERRLPVDAVFRALARDFGPRAIAILLAAEGSDGALGLQAIAAAGGMTMAQAPEAGLAAPGLDTRAVSAFLDHVLAPDDIAKALLDYLRFWTASEAGHGPPQRRRSIQERLVEICGILREQTGVDFKHYRTTTLVRRIERRMHVLRLGSVHAYVDRISSEAQEAHALFRELLIGVTAFFRDAEAFASLAENALAPLLANRSQSDPVRIWVAPCASGEEAYSIAILVREILDKMQTPPKVQIFATDVNERAVVVARRGHYPQGIAASLSPERLARFFIKHGRRYQVTQELREMVLFSLHNVIADPPFSHLDLVSCRNLLIYLGSHLQKKLIPLFHYALRRGGYLFLGSSETLTGHGALFRMIDIRHRLAQRKDTPLRTLGHMNEPGRPGLPGLRDIAPQAGTDLGAVAQRIILDEFAPRYAIVNEDGLIVFLSEGIERYIQPQAGAFANHIMRMARRGLSVGMRTAFAEALRNRRAAVSEITMRTSEGPERLRLTVQPMPELGRDEGLYMFVFQRLGSAPPSARGDQPSAGLDADGVIERLEQELMRARDELDRTVQDLEAANEELKSSNEELLSMNEELQAANEELETSKEDAQAANEALWAANADLDNHLRAIPIATIFLDQQGAIRGFTPAASEIYHLVPSDVGRPLGHFAHAFVEPPPLPGIDAVSDRSEPIEDEVQTKDGRWLTRRALPYRDKTGVGGGLVITFLDVTRRKQDEELLRQAEHSRRVALDAASMGMWWWDAGEEQIVADERVCELLGISTEVILTRELFLACIDPRDRDRMKGGAYDPGADKDQHNLEFRVATEDGSTRWLASIGRRRGSARGASWSGVIFDITNRKRIEEEAKRATELLDNVAQVTDNLIYVKDRDSRLLFANPALLSLTGQSMGDRVPDWHADRSEAEAIVANDRRIMETGKGEVVEEAFTPAGGETRFFSSNKKPMLGPDGQVIGIMGVSSDITARKKAEAALAESERNFRLLFEQAAVGIEQAALDGRITAVNDQLCVMLGYSREELLTKNFVDITYPADLPRERRRQKRLHTGKVDRYDFEKRYVRRNGTRLWARVTSSLARDDAGAVLYRISIIQDISERQRAQQELRESEARYRATFDQAAIGIAHVALDGRWLAVNDRLGAITGYSREELLRGRFQDITHPDDLDNNLALVAELVSGNRKTVTMEKRYLRKDGAIVWVSLTSVVVRNDDGAAAYLISVIEDITEDRRATLTDARLAAIVRSSQDAIFSFDHDDIIGSWNNGAEQLFGYRPEEIIGQSHAILVPPHKMREARDAVDRLAQGEAVISLESERRRKDGTVFPCVVTKSQIHASSGKLLGFSSIIRDVTERRLWEERQRLMTRELVHRVKNSFAVIQSIVRQTQRSTPDPEAFARAFSGRLAAMAASHDLLTDRHWEGAGLSDLVSSQLAPFAAGGDKRVRVKGPDVTLDTSLAVPLGLALHELATNATKYGSLSKPGGVVDLSWTVSRAGGAEQLSLVWRETGGPRPTAPVRRGFGTSLIERGLPDARIERRFEPEGLVCRIELSTSGFRGDPL